MAKSKKKNKNRRKNAGTGNILSAIVPIRTVAVKATSLETVAENTIATMPYSVRRRTVAEKLVNSMSLDEMLETSGIVEMGMKGEKIPSVKSPKVQKYAGAVLQLNRENNTRPMAEKMIHDLNKQIIKVNKKTTDAAESRRLYQELMAEK